MRSPGFLAVITLAVASTSFAQTPVPLAGDVMELDGVEQAAAERIFSEADAAVYFPELGRVRWLARRGQPADFVATLERDFPHFRWNAHGPYVLKLPDTASPLRADILGNSLPPTATAAVLTDSFENGLTQWQLGNDSSGDYNFTTMGCETHTGSWSVDAVRGGYKGQYLACWDGYPADVTTQITHNACEGIQGAGQAWLDFYLTAKMDDSERIGVYYLASDGYIWGYSFIGSWSGWFHIVLNLKQWNYIGDLTAQSCPKVIFQFKSDASATVGTGPQIDDVTIRTDAPSFLRASITATPVSGPAPLSVSFVSNVTGASGGESYRWRFGDEAGSTSTDRNATFAYTTAGDYWAELRVIDTNNTRAYARVKIQVTAPTGCTLTCGATVPPNGTAGTTVAFKATATATSCSSAPTYAWIFGDGQTSTQQNPSHTFANAGTYSWQLTVTAGGVTCSQNGSITIGTTGNGKRRAVRIPGDAQLDSETIGPAGGTLAGGGFTLTVPAGAFSANANLRLLSGGNSTPLDKFRTSKVFGLEGLPDDRAQPVTITLDITRSVSVTGSDFIAVANEVFVPPALVSPPMLLSATRSGSKITATIPATPSSQGKATARGALEPQQDTPQSYSIWSATGFYSFDSAQGHFHVKYPASDIVLGGAEEVAKGLESAYTSIAALGFEWNRRTSWPVSVCIEPFGADTNTRLAETVPSRWGINSYWLHVNANRLTTQADIPAMKDAAAHELFHLAQYLYDPRNRWTMATQPGTWLWADEATAVWFENYFNGTAILPQVVKENHAFMTKRGLEFPPGGTETVQDHGYGAAQLMRDLANRKGNEAVGEFVRRKSNSQVLPVDAYNTQTGSSAGTTWRLFMEEYAAAHLYTGFPTPADLWGASSGNRYSFATSSDNGTTFTWTAPDMSARFYGVQFTDKTWAAGTTVTLTLTDSEKEAVSLVYTLRSGQLTRLGYHYDGDVFKVENAETFANNATSLFIIVANGRTVRPYTGTTPITLRVSAGAHSELKFYVPGVPCSSGLTLAMSFWNTFKPEELTWSGNTVRASFSGSLFGNDQTEYTGMATLSADRRTLVSLDFTYHSIALFSFSYCTPAGCRWEDWQSITWTGVTSAADWQPNEFHFSAAGVVARDKITAFSMREVRSGYVSASENFDCRFPIDETRVNEIKFDMWLTPP